jgi:hypothetical protein
MAKSGKIDTSIYPELELVPVSKTFFNLYDQYSLKGALDDEITSVGILC